MADRPPFAGPELERARRPLLAFARSLGNDPERAEELVQATLATALERRASFDGARALQPWLCGILARLNARPGRRPQLALEDVEPSAPESFDPARRAERGEVGEALARALAAASATDRAVLEPWLAGEDRPAALARTLGLTPAATRVRLHRARVRLRERLPRGLATIAALLGLGHRRAEAAPRAGTALLAGLVVGALGLAAWPVARWIGGAPADGDASSPPTSARPGRPDHAALAGIPARLPAPPREALPKDAAEVAAPLAALSPPRRFLRGPRAPRVPPGTVFHPGGDTIVGTTPEALQRLLEADPDVAKFLRALDAETPQQTVAVAPFHLGTTEVTNEQYEVFVRATGHRPPEHWGRAAIDAAAREFLTRVGGANVERRRDGRPPLPTIFDRAGWWDENAPGTEWSLPAGEERHPVVHVDYGDVLAYCRWAGVRPPSEFEYQHAARGATARTYPWGEAWEDGRYAATAEDREHRTTRPAGTFPEGRSPTGVWDLAGNAWEWTASPYVPYPRFEKNTYEIEGAEEKMPEPTWDGNQRVVMGGCYQTSRLVARCTVRRPTDRDQRSNGLGFRIAASPHAARDRAAAVAPEWNGVLVDLAPDAAVGVDRWSARPPRADDPAGYAVITGYSLLALVPSRAWHGGADWEGLLLTSEPLEVPPLDPGEYAVARIGDELVFRDRESVERARVPAPAARPGGPAVEWWTEVAADGAEEDGLSLTAGGQRVDLLPRTPLHGWRR